MPQGPGTYGSQRGRPPKKSGFKLTSGNTTPFKQMGSSPLKQDYVGNIYDAKWNPSGTVDFEGRPTAKAQDFIKSKFKDEKFRTKLANYKFAGAKKPGLVRKVLRGTSKVLSKAALPATVAEFMYGAYTSGQKSSGGRYGFKQNPNYNPAVVGPKHGDASDNAKFIPTKGLYKDMYSSGPSKIIKPK